MAFIQWTDKYSVQVQQFDEAHQQLITLMNELHTAMSSGQGMSIIKDVLMRLREYTEFHFKDEETLMSANAYPELAQHQKLHHEFVNRVKEFELGAQEGKMLLSLEILGFLKNWLIHHIGEVDKKYSNFFNDKGIK